MPAQAFAEAVGEERRDVQFTPMLTANLPMVGGGESDERGMWERRGVCRSSDFGSGPGGLWHWLRLVQAI